MDDTKPPEPIAYRYTPATDGDTLSGIPAKDMTQAEWDRLDPQQQFNALHPGPSGKPMYTAVKAPKSKDGDA